MELAKLSRNGFMDLSESKGNYTAVLGCRSLDSKVLTKLSYGSIFFTPDTGISCRQEVQNQYKFFLLT